MNREQQNVIRRILFRAEDAANPESPEERSIAQAREAFDTLCERVQALETERDAHALRAAEAMREACVNVANEAAKDLRRSEQHLRKVPRPNARLVENAWVGHTTAKDLAEQLRFMNVGAVLAGVRKPEPTPQGAAEAMDANVCEHGDHPAPEGQRYCSAECRECDGEEPGDDDCAALCRERLPLRRHEFQSKPAPVNAPRSESTSAESPSTIRDLCDGPLERCEARPRCGGYREPMPNGGNRCDTCDDEREP